MGSPDDSVLEAESCSEEGLGFFGLLPTQQPHPNGTDKSVISHNLRRPRSSIMSPLRPFGGRTQTSDQRETAANIHQRPMRVKPNSVPESALATPTILSTFLRPPMSPPPSSDLDDLLCSPAQQRSGELESDTESRVPVQLHGCGLSGADRAWAYWTALGRPSLLVAPMVDNSELPFRMLCRKYGARAAYTPMLHSRIFTENEKYRSQEFTTCKEDRPLFVQFCANDPDILLTAAKRVAPFCDYVDINLGCPQRIARRGNYGAFLMDNLPLVKSLVQKLANNLHVPVSCKIRVFPKLEDTLSYARMLEDAGCSLLAVHGRTRDEKDGKKFQANWAAIRAVKNAVSIPVLANGNIRHMEDVMDCLEETGCEGVLSAETLLENPALFAGYRTAKWVVGDEETSNRVRKLDQAELLIEYLKFCEQYPVPWRMIRSHVHKLLGDWFRIHPEIREELNSQSRLTFDFLYDMVDRLRSQGLRIPLYQKVESVQCIRASSTR